MFKKILTGLSLVPVCLFAQVQVTSVKPGGIEDIMLPKGYQIEVYANGVTNAREMDFAEDGTLFVGSSDAGKVYAIRPDHSVIIIDEGLNMPAGLDCYNGDLYVAEISRILKYENILKTMETSPVPKVINKNFPSDRENGLKFIRVGPEGKLYIPIGAPCNACIPDSVWHGRIIRMTTDGKEIEYYAEGVRNAGGFDWNPATGMLWFTDDGRDDLKDDRPADELNKSRTYGEHFGFPYINGKFTDNKFWLIKPQGLVFTTPAFVLPPNVVPLGMRFYTGEMFDKTYKGGIFIAEYGSLNRKHKTGCRISFVGIKDDRPAYYEIFASGWLQEETAWGRPADVQVGPDGSLFVSDELKGCIYRIFK